MTAANPESSSQSSLSPDQRAVLEMLRSALGDALSYALENLINNAVQTAVQQQLLKDASSFWRFLKGTLWQNIGSAREIGIGLLETAVTDAVVAALTAEMKSAGYSEYIIQPETFAVKLALNNFFAIINPEACGGPQACAAFATISTKVDELKQVGQETTGLWGDVDRIRADFVTMKQQAEVLNRLGLEKKKAGDNEGGNRLLEAANSTYQAINNLRKQYTILGVSIFDAPEWTNILEIGRGVLLGR